MGPGANTLFRRSIKPMILPFSLTRLPLTTTPRLLVLTTFLCGGSHKLFSTSLVYRNKPEMSDESSFQPLIRDFTTRSTEDNENPQNLQYPQNPRYFKTSLHNLTEPKSTGINTQKPKTRESLWRLLLTKAPFGMISSLFRRIKWLLVRDTNKLSTFDTVSAFISWLVMGNILWILLGTSSFGLALLYCIHYFDKLWHSEKGSGNDDNEANNENNTGSSGSETSILGYIASAVLSHGLGMSIMFQKGNILPEFKDGKLRFSNVKILSNEKIDKKHVLTADIDHMDVSLSFNKWYEGNGLIYDIEIFGLNGKFYKPTRIQHSLEPPFSTADVADVTKAKLPTHNFHINEDHYIDDDRYLSSVHTFLDSNYKFEHVKINDSYCEIYDEAESSPTKITIFSGDFSPVCGDRLVLDFFNANNVSGAINDSMFTIHKRQDQNVHNAEDSNVVRFKIDGINMGLVSSRNASSKFNWIIGGKAQVLADIKFPSENQILASDYSRITKIFGDMVDDLGKVTTKEPPTNQETRMDDKDLLKGALAAIYHTFTKPETSEPTSPYVMVSFKVKFTDLKASLPQTLPVASSNTPFISLPNLRTLIQYINDDHKPKNPIIIKTTVIEKVNDLYNISDITSTKIFDSIVSDIYEEFLKMVKQNEKRIINEKSHLWSHSLASQILLLGLGVLV
jgi:distribution and morphology protein 32